MLLVELQQTSVDEQDSSLKRSYSQGTSIDLPVTERLTINKRLKYFYLILSSCLSGIPNVQIPSQHFIQFE